MQRVLEVAGRDALEVEDRDQHLQALQPARVRRQNRRRKADALATFAAAVTHARAAHSDRTDSDTFFLDRNGLNIVEPAEAAAGAAAQSAKVPLTTVFSTEKFEARVVVEKLSDPARESRVAAAISTSAGELVLETTFPDGGNAESVGDRGRPARL
jgi:hypothetical protein